MKNAERRILCNTVYKNKGWVFYNAYENQMMLVVSIGTSQAWCFNPRGPKAIHIADLSDWEYVCDL